MFVKRFWVLFLKVAIIHRHVTTNLFSLKVYAKKGYKIAQQMEGTPIAKSQTNKMRRELILKLNLMHVTTN